MSEIEKIQQYIRKTKISPDAVGRYCMTWEAMDALYNKAIKDASKAFSALTLAFDYGMAKGYRAAKAEARRE